MTLHSAGTGTLTTDTFDPETGRLIETRTADGLAGNGNASSTSPSSPDLVGKSGKMGTVPILGITH